MAWYDDTDDGGGGVTYSSSEELDAIRTAQVGILSVEDGTAELPGLEDYVGSGPAELVVITSLHEFAGVGIPLVTQTIPGISGPNFASGVRIGYQPAATWIWTDWAVVSGMISPGAGALRVVVAETNGALDVRDQSTAAVANTFVLRDAFGHVKTAAPAVGEDAATKTYADALGVSAPTVSTVMRRDAAGRSQVVSPSAGSDVANKTYADALGVSAPTVSTIMRRDAAGRSQVVTPSAANDIANKTYVDTGGWVAVPASATATGTAGQKAYATGFLYICVATNTWQRVAIATW